MSLTWRRWPYSGTTRQEGLLVAVVCPFGTRS